MERAKEILKIQLDAVSKLEITANYEKAIDKLIEVRNGSNSGRIIITGMGKAGIIGFKMSATLASIGFPSFFISPAEAGHGDLGRIAPDDLIIVFSNSGSTGELVSMINSLHNFNEGKNFVITIGGSNEPKIPTDLVISYGKIEESCVVSKVPSTSTTLMLIIADIISITAAEKIGLNDDWFKIRHPGGAIGVSYKKDSK